MRGREARASLLVVARELVLIPTTTRAADISDLNKTPSAVRGGLTKNRICEIKWGKDARHVTAKMKREVFALYGYTGDEDPHCVPGKRGRRCEIDHLISRELGDADEVKNFWPEAYGTKPWNTRLEGKLENRPHKEMCARHSTLRQARDMPLHDRRVPYRKYYGELQQ